VTFFASAAAEAASTPAATDAKKVTVRANQQRVAR
jgi:hypothetical protein